MGFSIVSLVEAYLRRSFLSAGLRRNTLHLDEDTTIAYWLSSSSSTTTTPKPPLLLIHGFGPDAIWQWNLQVRPLSRHFTLLIPDLLFFGSSTTRSTMRSEAFQAACLVRLLDSLTFFNNDISVVGTSYGGFVAYHLARELGEGRVKRVVLASSDVMKRADDDVALKNRADVENVGDLMLPRTTWHLKKLIGMAVHRRPRFMAPDFILRDILRRLFSANLEEKIELIKGLTLGNKDQFQISPLPQEVLIVWGEHDNIFPLEKAYELKQQLGDKAKLEILKNTSHVPQTEDPSRFNEVILKFLLDEPRPSM